MKEYKSTLQHHVNQADLQRKYKDIDSTSTTQANFRDPLKMKLEGAAVAPSKQMPKKLMEWIEWIPILGEGREAKSATQDAKTRTGS